MRAVTAVKSSFYEGQLERAVKPEAHGSPAAPLLRSLARAQSMSTLPPTVNPFAEIMRQQKQNLPPGTFILGGYGHGVIVPPPRLPTSASAVELPKLAHPKGETSVSDYIAIHHSASPRVQYRHWIEELDTNPAYMQQKQDEKKRRQRRATR